MESNIMFEFVISVTPYQLLMLSLILVVTGLATWNTLDGMDNRNKHNKEIMAFSIAWTLICLTALEIICIIVVICRPSLKLRHYIEDKSIVFVAFPMMIERYGYTMLWNVSDLVIAERKLSGLCIECGIGDSDKRLGHHELCKLHNNPNREPGK